MSTATDNRKANLDLLAAKVADDGWTTTVWSEDHPLTDDARFVTLIRDKTDGNFSYRVLAAFNVRNPQALNYLTDVANNSDTYEPVGIIDLEAPVAEAFSPVRLEVKLADKSDSLYMYL